MKSKYVIRVFTLLSMCVFTAQIFAGSFTQEFSFPLSSLKTDYQDGYALVTLAGCDLTLQQTGKPILPFANLSVLLPSSAEIIGIEILDAKSVQVPGEYLLYPAQEPRILSDQSTKPFIAPDPLIYQMTSEYPGKMSDIIPSGNKSGYRIGGVFLYPLQYLPAEQKLVLYTRVKIRINYEENIHEPWQVTESQKALFSEDVKSLVINPQDVNRFSPPIRVTDNPDIDYVILTNATLEPRFAPLVTWLKKTGIKAETRTTAWVYANYTTGRDNQEKIRNFIIDYFNTEGLKYVLLAGDVSVIPARVSYASVATTPPTVDNSIPCDLYYFDLQWSWDGNNDNIFGQAGVDTVDFYYDVYGGRWPVETTAEVDTMIRKFFTYVKNPDMFYQKRMLLPAASLWSGYDHVQSQDSIAALSPAGWTDRVINMGSNDAWRWAVRDSLNTGFGFSHLVGHGNDLGVYITTGQSGAMYYYTDPASQTNYNKLTIANSIACISGNFEYNDCLAEKMVLARGSAIATIMNSRYGWGWPPLLGPSEKLDIRFFHYFFTRDSVRIANCHQASKENYRSSALTDDSWRWCYYELNLFGEPQMFMWKDNPKNMTAGFNNPTYAGSQNFAVTCSSQGLALSGASVCLWKGTEVYAKGTTGSNGQVSLSINPSTTGNMYVTVTAKNRIPFEDSCSVIFLSDVGVTAIEVPASEIDSTGPIMPRVRIENFGGQPATFNAKLTIGSYTSTRASKTIGAGANDTVNFAVWTPMRGTYPIKCSVYMSGDAVFTNDTMSGEITVQVKDVGVVAITVPNTDTIDRAKVAPRASVRNYGTQAETFYTYCKIYNSVGTQLYYDSVLTTDLNPNAQSTRTFSGFNFQIGSYEIRCSTALVNDVNITNDIISKTVFVRYQQPWIAKESIPRGPSNKQVKNGGALVAGIGGNLFALKGNNTREFYTYDIEDDTWVLLDSIPFDTLKSKKVNKGAALAYNKHVNPDIVYATKGNNTLEFWAYDVDLNTWIQKSSVPQTPSPAKQRRVKGGGCIALVNNNDSQYVFLLKGNKTNEFYAYHCQTDSWQRNLTQAPLGSDFKPYKDGTCITPGDSNKLYVLKGGGKINEFYSYNTATGIWRTLTPLPIYSSVVMKNTKVKTGASLCYNSDSLIFAFKGGGKQDFWQYNISQNRWLEKEPLPKGSSNKNIGNGGGVAFAENMVHALKGNNTREFWSYLPATNITDIDIQYALTNHSVYSQETAVKLDNNLIINSASQNSRINFTLPENSNVKITLYNNLGQLVTVVLQNKLAPGEYSLPLGVQNLSAGIYYLRYEINQGIRLHKIVISH
ncbi:MAG: T9SS type A sorting domain-containing protein [Candidatus Latescibacteria bacterium]|nr:T9SS type A sorting domain-containing protein [Candidatus Latescibacterota bacterium]